MVVRFLQPFVLSGMILVYFTIVNSATNIGLFFGTLCITVVYLVFRYVEDGISIRNQQHLVRPAKTSDHEVS